MYLYQLFKEILMRLYSALRLRGRICGLFLVIVKSYSNSASACEAEQDRSECSEILPSNESGTPSEPNDARKQRSLG